MKTVMGAAESCRGNAKFFRELQGVSKLIS